jgi:His-Xaa-Ser system protein HxsD
MTPFMDARPTDLIDIDFDPAVYRLSAVKKAAYKFGARCFVTIGTQPNGLVRVTLRLKPGTHPDGSVEGEFRNEVLDQELREAILEETAPVRNLLLAQAFSAISLIDREAETADYRQDPLTIGRSQLDERGVP